jgi:hypothetical protein
MEMEMMKTSIALTLTLVASSTVHAECPSLTGAWDLNFTPTAKVADQNKILFSNTRLLLELSGNRTVFAGFGTEWPVAEALPTFSRFLDEVTTTLRAGADCRLQFKADTTEKIRYSGGSEEAGIPVSLRVKGDYVPLLGGYAGIVTLTEKGKKIRNSFTMTRVK